MNKKLIPLFAIAASLTLVACSSISNRSNFVSIRQTRTLTPITDLESKTLYDLGDPSYVAGTSYYSNGLLTYTSAGSTVGYAPENLNFLLNLDITFTNEFAWPSWFSINLRTSGFDRTMSPNLEQKGYTFMVRPSGSVVTYKDGSLLDGVEGTYSGGFVVGEQNKVICGAVQEDESIRIVFKVNDDVLIDYTDSDSPLVSGGNNFFFCADNVVSALIDSDNVPAPAVLPDFDKSEYEIVSFTDFGSPTIAGTSTYEDGVINYTSSSSTVGYNLKDSNVIHDFNMTFTGEFTSPSWLSFNLRASGFNRTHSSALENLGYVFIIRPNGSVSLAKDRSGVALESTNPFVVGTKYSVQIGAVAYEDGIRVVLYVDDTLVVDYFDATNPLTDSGNWFIICSDAGNATVSATFESTKEIVVPEYPVYTFSMFRSYPTLAGSNKAKVDKYNNFTISEASQTVGFSQGLQNFSLSGTYVFHEIGNFANFWMALRMTSFNRASSISSGYAIRLGQIGAVEIYKSGDNGGKIGSGSYHFDVNTEYYIEFGAVDYSAERTRIFIAVNNRVIVDVFDDNSPLQNPGWVCFNSDGVFTATVGSSIKTIVPLRQKINSTADYTDYALSFNAAFDIRDLAYEDFTQRVLESIKIGKNNVLEFNALYYGLDANDEKIRGVDVFTTSNKIVIRIQNELFKVADDQPYDLGDQTIKITRTGSTSGFITPDGSILKNSYVFN